MADTRTIAAIVLSERLYGKIPVEVVIQQPSLLLGVADID